MNHNNPIILLLALSVGSSVFAEQQGDQQQHQEHAGHDDHEDILVELE